MLSADSSASSGRSSLAVQSSCDLTGRIDALQVIAIRRRQAVLAEGNVQRQIKSFVRRLMAQTAEPLGEKKPVTDKHIKRFADHTVIARLSEVRKALLAWRADEEKQMRAAICGLPTLDSFWLPVPGLGELGFAQLLGESGNLSHYAAPAKLWRRFGLHVFNGKAGATWKSGGLSAEQWIQMGYCPRRRSLVFLIVDSLLKKSAGNRYYDLYKQIKADERVKAKAAGLTVLPAKKIPKDHPEQYRSLKHVDMRARRRVGKVLLRDLWRAWRDQSIFVAIDQSAVVSPRPAATDSPVRASLSVPDNGQEVIVRAGDPNSGVRASHAVSKRTSHQLPTPPTLFPAPIGAGALMELARIQEF